MKKGGRLASVSVKRRATFAARKKAMEAVAARSGGYCEAARLIEQVDSAAAGRCQRWATEGHEPLTRARGGDPTDPSQVVHICSSCHAWCHSQPVLATQVGLLESQWKVEG